jgi:hypothetical protein
MRMLNRTVELAETLPCIEAADLVTGGRADFGRVIGEHGRTLELIRREPGEDHGAFRVRLKLAGKAQEGRFTVLGGIDPAFKSEAPLAPVEVITDPNVVRLLAGPLHPAQRRALRVAYDNRRAVWRCGRRFGKTTALEMLAVDDAIRGRFVSFVAPQYRLAMPVFDDLTIALQPIVERKDRTMMTIKLTNGGAIDVWTCEGGASIARGRRYHRQILDEIAHVADISNMPLIWSAALEATLLDYRGTAVAASTPWGVSPANFFFQICHSERGEWQEYHAPTSLNPAISADELKRIEESKHPLTWRQEYLGEFTNLDGASIFDLTRTLQADGQPWPAPDFYDLFYCCIDTALKGGVEHDGSACVFVGLTELDAQENGGPPPILWILDWSVTQIRAHVLEEWIEWIIARVRELTGEGSRRRFRSMGPIWIEDAAAGAILLEKFEGRAMALPQTWTKRGKDLRCVDVESYFNSGRVRFTEEAYNKVELFREVRMNHLWTQLSSFVIGDKAASKRADDLLDAAVYTALVATHPWPADG